MRTVVVEVTNGPHNWGKILVGRMDIEWERKSVVSESSRSLLAQIGWSPGDIWVLDLQTCEGAAFSPGGSAASDLVKRSVWVCPMFEPFLTWLYRQDLTDLSSLPAHVDLSLKEAPFEAAGYRRPGRGREQRAET